MYHLAWVPTVAPTSDFEERVTLYILLMGLFLFFFKKKKTLDNCFFINRMGRIYFMIRFGHN